MTVLDILDFSILGDAFFTSSGDALFDERADFNEDDDINILDFSLLSTNFGVDGDQVPYSAARNKQKRSHKIIPEGKALLHFENGEIRTSPGSLIEVPILIEASSMDIDGAQFVLQYDPGLLAIQSVDKGQLSTILHDEIDAETGRLTFAAGALNEVRSSGEFVVVAVQFLVLDEFADLTLEIQSDAMLSSYGYPVSTDIGNALIMQSQSAGEKGVVIYPIPFMDGINLNLISLTGTVQIEVWDELGRRVHQYEVDSKVIQDRVFLNLSDRKLTEGIYHLKVSDEEGFVQWKQILKQ